MSGPPTFAVPPTFLGIARRDEDARDECDGLEHPVHHARRDGVAHRLELGARANEAVGVARPELGVDDGREAVVEQCARAGVRARRERELLLVRQVLLHVGDR